LEYVLYGAGLHHSSEIHDDDSIGDMIDHTEVMADEQIGQVEALAQVHEEIDDLGLDGDVESRDAFVADEKLWPDGERTRDTDALTLTTGKLVRIAIGHRRI